MPGIINGYVVAGMYGKAGHPVFSKAAIDQTNDDMKHLEFVRAYGQYYCTKVAYAYSSSCAVLPASCRTGLRNLENKVTTLSAPIINGLQQSSERVLWSLDSKVRTEWPLEHHMDSRKRPICKISG